MGKTDQQASQAKFQTHIQQIVDAKKHLRAYKGEYHFDMTAFFNIWFSLDETIFLPSLNKLRLIRNRAQNPELKMTLVYSSTCLNDKAQADLTAFANNLKITLIDFDRELYDKLEEDIDKEIHALATIEILKARTHAGGNMAAASDMVRLISVLHHDYGHYTDFEAALNLRGTPESITGAYPVLTNSRIYAREDARGIRTDPTVTNNVILVARHPDAYACLNAMKQKIIEHYRNFDLQTLMGIRVVAPDNDLFQGMLAFSIHKFCQENLHHSEEQLYQYVTQQPGVARQIIFSETNPIYTWLDDCSNDIYKFRLKLREMQRSYPKDDPKHNFLRYVYEATVINVTGPQICLMGFQNYQHVPNIDKTHVDQQYAVYMSVYYASFVTNGLENAIVIPPPGGASQTHGRSKQVVKVGDINDKSWTPVGYTLLNEKSNRIDAAATSIQRLWRAKQAPNIPPAVRSLVIESTLKSAPDMV